MMSEGVCNAILHPSFDRPDPSCGPSDFNLTGVRQHSTQHFKRSRQLQSMRGRQAGAGSRAVCSRSSSLLSANVLKASTAKTPQRCA